MPVRYPLPGVLVILPGAAISVGDRDPVTSEQARPVDTDYRGYAGQIANGVLRAGDEVVVLPGGQRTRIAAIETLDGQHAEATAPLSVTVRLADNIDVSRGDVICPVDQQPVVSRELEATICWMSEHSLRAGDRLSIKHATRSAQAIVVALDDRVDVTTLEAEDGIDAVALNDSGRVRIKTSAPLMCDPYRVNRATGGFVLVDDAKNGTVAAGMIDAAR